MNDNYKLIRSYGKLHITPHFNHTLAPKRGAKKGRDGQNGWEMKGFEKFRR